MRTWLKRMVAGIVSAGTLMGGGLLMAGTANADEIRMPDIGKTITSTARPIAGKSNSLPTELVNGDFTYKGRQCLDTARKAAGNDYQSDWNFANIDYVKGDAGAARKWAHIDGFQASGFGWKSNQTDAAVDGRAPIAEIQQSRDGSNYYGEITASQANTYLYQDIDTRHDFSTVYTVKLKHASRTLAMGVDSLQVLVGTPGHERPVELTRIASDGKDQVGEKSNVVASAVSGWNGKWDTYTGSVTIPANQPVTRFTFKSITGIDNVAGNLIDDVRFAYAYPLSYDANGGTKQQASQISSKTFGKASETDGKAKTMQDASGLPANAVPAADAGQEKLTNGDFEYPGARSLHMDHSINWSAVERKSGERFEPNAGKWVKLDGFDANRFGWDSSETDGPSVGAPNQRRANEVELQLDRNDNIYAELAANQAGTSIKQTIRTVKDVAYTVSLKHASLTDEYVDRMRVVMIAADGTRTVVPMTRTVSNGHGDKVGEKSEVIATKVTNTDTRDHAKQWETYTGTYIATGGSTTFTFESVDSRQANLGNLLDDVSFKTAYKLDYDGNNGKGRVPSSSKADSTQPAAFKAPAARTEAIASKANGTVRLAADGDTEPESGTTTDDRGILTDTIARQDDGTGQRTITRSDGSVQVQAIADTGAVSGCQVYYPAGARITLATAKIDSDCWDSSQIGKTNRTFYGWSANTDSNDRDVPVADTMDRNTLNANARTEIVMPARAKTVYALWAVNPTLSYNVNAPQGSTAPGTPASRTILYNTAASDTSGWTTGVTGKIPGYRFDGWYTAPNGGNKYDFNTPLINNVTVYAHWIGNGYTVRFTGNGATGGNTPDQAFQYNIGQNLRRNGFTRDGYTFTGWKRADNQQAYGDGQWVTNLTTQPDGIVTMVAQWSANEAHIRYNPNPPAGKTAGGNGTPNWDGHTGDTPAIGGNGWTIDGYTFAGWTTSPDGGGTKYAPGASWTASGTLTLYAQWTPGEAGLTYDGNGATGGKTDPQNGVTDQKVNVRQNGFTRDGYTFVRWDTQADCRGKAVDPGDKWTLQGSSTLYACWTGNMQPLTYHGNGATGGNTAAQSGKTGDELTTNANGFTRDGYTFVRWDTAKDGSGTAYGEGKNGVGRYTMKPTGNDLYAIWQANPASIQYRDDYGATGSTPDTTGVTGQNVTIAQNGFTRPGYTFTGWARDRRTDPSLQPGGRYTLTPGTTTLWAQWKADPAHLIYNSNSGSTSQTRRTDGVVDQTLTVIANPFTRSGYTFTGWNTQADGRGKAYAAGNGFRLVADAKSNPVNTSVLYAQWRINRVALKFDPNGGTGGYPDITVDALTTVTIPADAKEPKVSRPGFRFTGWAMKPTPGAGDTILGPGNGTVTMPDQGSITVYAQWAPAMTTLPFTGGHAQVPTIGLYAGLVFMILAMGALMPVIRLRMGAGSKGRHAGTPTIGRHSR
ncbi:InlB B-repeat-containing protein [Bifidobacterium longum subsp. infantis]|uniref:InlB B-repeat-containing protein n=1 Tax=Bifidobacterium longum subsp. infantis TaxID=1682 RepID=A0AAX1LJ72_BIFLI|nr:InlB B-repeat-containing protein [Bifidobacterium longum]QSP97274.1 InlB B-repeat-containing protein [Bifidobacterium longum subsp. infantis]QSZ17521.1 InlB B-repeat-containing protein [Bifidobacterium longum subsp. infantis]QTB92998.1 InlB B-repeat-containing protein [Bifidobacterium longum subsp. infantis]